MTHDPALCPAPVCALCDAYGDGYTAGKAALNSEFRNGLAAPAHATDCGCRPCLMVQAVLERLVDDAPLTPRFQFFARLLELRHQYLESRR